VDKIRVALLEMKPRLRDMLTDVIAREQDMQLIDFEVGTIGQPPRNEPDVMVREIDNPLDCGIATSLLHRVPRARLLMVADTGEQAVLYELHPKRQVFLNVSIDQVIHAIRYGLPGDTGWSGTNDRRGHE
jgi:hypothetical protein